MRSSREKVRYGLLIDIGSGSVGFAVVASNKAKTSPEIIWETREHVKVRHIDSISDSCRTLLAVLTDMAMNVSTEGIQAVQKHSTSKRTKLSEIQVTVAAPWSYTVSRNITYEQTESFPVTNTLIHDLAVAAGDDAMKSFKEKYKAVVYNITETSRCVLDAYANGYRLPMINKQKTSSLVLTHTTTLIHGQLYKTLDELGEKLFPGTPLHITSSMLSMYFSTRQLKPHIYDVCLVDITDEATEIGIVRNGALSYCTHAPLGLLAIAREIAQDADRPLSEVVSRLGDIIEQKQTKSATVIIKAYQEKVTELLKETGDALSIPRTIYLLADQSVLPALTPIITQAGKTASKTDTTVVPIAELLKQTNTTSHDFALKTAARFFHTTDDRHQFEYL